MSSLPIAVNSQHSNGGSARGVLALCRGDDPEVESLDGTRAGNGQYPAQRRPGPPRRKPVLDDHNDVEIALSPNELPGHPRPVQVEPGKVGTEVGGKLVPDASEVARGEGIQ